MQQMIPHHENAVNMARILLKNPGEDELDEEVCFRFDWRINKCLWCFCPKHPCVLCFIFPFHRIRNRVRTDDRQIGQRACQASIPLTIPWIFKPLAIFRSKFWCSSTDTSGSFPVYVVVPTSLLTKANIRRGSSVGVLQSNQSRVAQ